MADQESALSSAFSNTLAGLIDKAFQHTINNSKESANFVATRLAVGFEQYIATAKSRCLNVKTLLSGGAPVRLEKSYEPAILNVNGISVPIDEFIRDLGNIRNRAIITATLGSGKSFTMRYIYSSLAGRSDWGRIPLFIELRNVPFSEKTLTAYIADLLSPFTHFVSERSIISGLKAGIFALVLDGFDEVSVKHRRSADIQINRIASDYPRSVVVVSSRPDERFVSWHSFPEYQIEPLTLPRLESLLQRIDFDETDKDLFIKRLGKGLFKSHKKILENPLLASMMLLTFKEFQDVPSKMHVFYGTAFDVLYRRHDATKPDYQREFASGLDLTDFKRAFMTFCFMSYIDRVYSFDSGSFLKYTTKSLQYEEISAKSEDFLFDIENNICICHKEGDDIDFIHRSFQEYFAAQFLSKRSIEQAYDFIDTLISENSASEFFDMLIEIDSEEFERKYFLEKLARIDEELSSAKTIKEKIAAISSQYAVGYFGDEEENRALFVPIFLRTKYHDNSKSQRAVDPYRTPVRLEALYTLGAYIGANVGGLGSRIGWS